MSSVKIRQVVGPEMIVGEGPHWEENNKSLIFVDIIRCSLHRYFPDTDRHQVLHLDECGTGKFVGFVLPVEDDPNLLVVGLGRNLAVIEWSPSDPDDHTTQAKAVLHTVDEHHPTNRFNDAKCDPQGRIWAGTMAQESSPGVLENHLGSLYCLDDKFNLSKHVEKVSISNGLAWSHDRKTFYYIDSLEFSVDAFNYEDSTGQISNRRKILDYKAAGLDKDIPDGMCIDENGHLWVANFMGSKIICIDPIKGEITRKIDTPAQNMTSVCWGGNNYDTLFATSARTGLSEAELASQPAGATFAITGLGVKGLKPSNFKVNLDTLKSKFTR